MPTLMSSMMASLLIGAAHAPLVQAQTEDVTAAPAAPMPAPPAAADVPPVEPGLTADRELPEPEITKKATTPVLKIGVGMRTGVAVSLDDGGASLNDGLLDQANLRPYMTADMTESVSFFTSFEIGTPKGLGSFAILDAIAQVKFRPEFQVWVGQHIGANDRNNMNGPFFGNGWNFAIGVPSYPFDVGARDRGVTFWGLIGGGRLKYHASVLDLQPGQTLEHARYGGRVTLHLLEPEDFYYNSGTYFGKKDVLAIGAVVNYQKGIEMPGVDNDFLGYSFDIFFEKNLGAPGTITLEGGYWDFSNVGAGYVRNQGTVDTGTGYAQPFPGTSFFAAASWLSPSKTGMGQLQPNARYQLGDYDGQPKLHVFDAGLGYIIDGFNHRWYLNYRHAKAAASDNIVQLGVQFMM